MNKTLEGFQTIDLNKFDIPYDLATTVAGLYKYIKERMSSKKNYILSIGGVSYLVNNADVFDIVYPSKAIVIRYGVSIGSIASFQQNLSVTEDDSAVIATIQNSGGGGGGGGGTTNPVLIKEVLASNLEFTRTSASDPYTHTFTAEEYNALVAPQVNGGYNAFKVLQGCTFKTGETTDMYADIYPFDKIATYDFSAGNSVILLASIASAGPGSPTEYGATISVYAHTLS